MMIAFVMAILAICVDFLLIGLTINQAEDDGAIGFTVAILLPSLITSIYVIGGVLHG